MASNQRQNLFGGRLQDSPDVKVVLATSTLADNDTRVLATIPASGSITITLPPPGANVGKVYHIRCDVDAGGTSVIVVHAESAVDLSFTITATTGFVTVMSVGDMYITLDSSAT